MNRRLPRVLAESRPHEGSVGVFAEPVDVENLGKLRGIVDATRHRQPVAKVVSHVVSCKWEHRERVKPRQTDN